MTDRNESKGTRLNITDLPEQTVIDFKKMALDKHMLLPQLLTFLVQKEQASMKVEEITF